MCANQTCSSVLAVSAPYQGRRNRTAFMKAMSVVVAAFQDALDMRRVALRNDYLSDQ